MRIGSLYPDSTNNAWYNNTNSAYDNQDHHHHLFQYFGIYAHYDNYNYSSGMLHVVRLAS